jgi:flagellar protein FlaG
MDISGVNRSGPAAPASVPAAAVENSAQNREVIQAVKALNAAEMFGDNNELQFQKDPQTQRMVVRIVDRQTKEVISQIPPEYVLQLVAESKQQKA